MTSNIGDNLKNVKGPRILARSVTMWGRSETISSVLIISSETISSVLIILGRFPMV